MGPYGASNLKRVSPDREPTGGNGLGYLRHPNERGHPRYAIVLLLKEVLLIRNRMYFIKVIIGKILVESSTSEVPIDAFYFFSFTSQLSSETLGRSLY